VAHQAAEGRAQIRIDTLPNSSADRLALEQIFSNLIDNALKYLSPAFPAMSRCARTKLVFAIFEIADNGPGIDPKDHQRHLRFIPPRRNPEQAGTRHRACHVRALVRRLGGRCRSLQNFHQGSTFTIRCLSIGQQ